MIIPSDPKAIAALSTSELCKYVEVLLLSLDARAVGVAATTEGITLSRLATDTTTDESIWRALYAISSELRKRRQAVRSSSSLTLGSLRSKHTLRPSQSQQLQL